MAASNLPLFGPFVRPVACIFPQHCDLLAIQISEFSPNDYAGVEISSFAAITFSNFGKNSGTDTTPSADWTSHNITNAQALVFEGNENIDQVPQDLTLSIGQPVIAEGVNTFDGTFITNLLLWTTGPSYYAQSYSSGTGKYAMAIRGYVFVNLSLLASKYGVAKTSAAPAIMTISMTGVGYHTAVNCWAEAIPHCRGAGFGAPNSLSHLGGITNQTAAQMGWANAHQSVQGWAQGQYVYGGATEGTFSPTIVITAYKGANGYIVEMSGSSFVEGGLGVTTGTGSD